MSLLNLLSTQYNLGSTITPEGLVLGGLINPSTPNPNLSYGGPSKTIRYGDRSGENKAPSYHLVDRVEWYGKDKGGGGAPHYNSNPTFLIGGDHKSVIPDFVFRGGENVFLDRRSIDYQRINNFINESDGVGTQFLIKHAGLQLLNPRKETRTFNAGVSLLASVAASGFSNIKRHGTIPEPAGININSSLGNIFGKIPGVGGFLSNVIGGDYISSTTNKYDIESDIDFQGNDVGFNSGLVGTRIKGNFGMGNPGAPKYGSIFGKLIDTLVDNPFKPKRSGRFDRKLRSTTNQKAYLQRLEDDFTGIDKINFLRPHMSMGDNSEFKKKKKVADLIPFKFIVPGQSSDSDIIIQFRAFLDSWSDDFNASHNETKFNGRGESFYTYNKFKRSINVSFKIAAQSIHEMRPIYQKLNYLAAQTAPGYSPRSGRIITPYIRLTMGDYFKNIPGVLSNVGIQWSKEYPWEINHENSQHIKQLPHVLDVSVAFLPIHDFVPNNDFRSSPFIGINNEDNHDQDWLATKPADTNYLDKSQIYNLDGGSYSGGGDYEVISTKRLSGGYDYKIAETE